MLKNLLTALFAFFLFSNAYAADGDVDMAKLTALAKELEALSQDATLVAAVKTQNQSSLSLAEIQKRDKLWIDTSGLDDFMTSLMVNKAAKHMSSIEKKKPFIVETFLMDNQGANVAMTNKTSDYWQGDEAKFKESFKGGKGAVHISDSKFDSSAQAYLVQISVPVFDEDKAIGAITYGVNIDKLK